VNLCGDESVLIVDDDPGAGEAFQYMLQREGYTVRVAVDAASAFIQLSRAIPAAMVVDLHLTNRSGLAMLQQLRATAGFASIPVAVVTGDYLVDERMIRDLQHLGAELYFKPLWEEDILRIVRTLLSAGQEAR